MFRFLSLARLADGWMELNGSCPDSVFGHQQAGGKLICFSFLLITHDHRRLPDHFRALCEGLVIHVEDFPTDEVLDDMEAESEFDLLGLFQGEIVATGQDLGQTFQQLIAKMVGEAEEPELLSLFYGHDVDAEQAEALAGQAAEACPDLDVETHFGGQPLYYFLIAVE